jgi:hypothetical protein
MRTVKKLLIVSVVACVVIGLFLGLHSMNSTAHDSTTAQTTNSTISKTTPTKVALSYSWNYYYHTFYVNTTVQENPNDTWTHQSNYTYQTEYEYDYVNITVRNNYTQTVYNVTVGANICDMGLSGGLYLTVQSLSPNQTYTVNYDITNQNFLSPTYAYGFIEA